MLGDLPYLKTIPIVSLDDLNNASFGIECLVIGNDCLNELGFIEFSGFVNVRMIDVGYYSLQYIEQLVLFSMMIDD